MRRTRKLRLRLVLAGTAGLAVVAFVAATSASPPHEPDLTSVASANTRAAGYAPSSKLSVELAGQVVAQGATPLENPTSLIGFYGYENDVVSADDPTKPQMVPTQGVANEAQKTEPDENTYLVVQARACTARTRTTTTASASCTRATRTRPPSNGVKQGLHHAHQPRRRPGAPRDAACDDGLERRGAQHDRRLEAGTRGPRKLIFTTENANAPTYSATAGLPVHGRRTSRARSGAAATRASQHDSDGQRDRSSRTSSGANKQGTTAKVPNSFVYRYVPRQSRRPAATGGSRCSRS